MGSDFCRQYPNSPWCQGKPKDPIPKPKPYCPPGSLCYENKMARELSRDKYVQKAGSIRPPRTSSTLQVQGSMSTKSRSRTRNSSERGNIPIPARYDQEQLGEFRRGNSGEYSQSSSKRSKKSSGSDESRSTDSSVPKYARMGSELTRSFNNIYTSNLSGLLNIGNIYNKPKK